MSQNGHYPPTGGNASVTALSGTSNLYQQFDKIKIQDFPLIFHTCSRQCDLSKEPDFVQSCVLTLFKTLQWFTSPTKQTQNSLASHVRFWLSVQKLLSHFYFQPQKPYPWAHWIALHFPNVLSTLLSLSLCLCHSFSEGWNSLPLLSSQYPTLTLLGMLPWISKCVLMFENLGNMSLGEILSFWLLVLPVGNKGAFSNLPTRELRLSFLILKMTHFHLKEGLNKNKTEWKNIVLF